MTEEGKTLDLHVNDLVLMNVVDIGEQGPIFEVIDRVGAIDVEEEPLDSSAVNSEGEHAATKSGVVGRSETVDLPKENPDNSLIAELEELRAALDIVIHELKRDVATDEALRLKDGGSNQPTTIPTADTSTIGAKARKMRWIGE